MKNILFIIPWLPYPMKTGGHQALYNGIYAIKDDLRVSLAYEVYDKCEYERALREFNKELPNIRHFPLIHTPVKPTIKRRLYNGIKSTIKNLMGHRKKLSFKKGVDNCKWWTDAVLPLKEEWLLHVKEITDSQSFDIIQVEMPWLLSQILTLPKESKRIFVHHELGFVRRELELQRLQESPYIYAMKRFADFCEIGELNMYDGVVTLSDLDAKKLFDNGIQVPVYPSFSTVKSDKMFQFSYSTEKRLTFVGSDVHTPNLIGLQWFLSNCWKKLRQQDSKYSLQIIGRWSKQNIKKFISTYPNVVFLEYVDDLAEALKGSVMIVPITEGSGIRMKIIEAASIGVPFVSTTIGASGIPVFDGAHCFIADNPDVFISAILNIQDAVLQEKFVKNSFKLVKERYSIEALRTNRLEIYDRVFVKET